MPADDPSQSGLGSLRPLEWTCHFFFPPGECGQCRVASRQGEGTKHIPGKEGSFVTGAGRTLSEKRSLKESLGWECAHSKADGSSQAAEPQSSAAHALRPWERMGDAHGRDCAPFFFSITIAFQA